MTTERRTFLRTLFEMAWDMKRCAPERTFAACLMGAWRIRKEPGTAARRMVARARGNGGHLRLSASLIRSPIQRSLSGTRYGNRADYKAAYLTARLGY